MAANFVVTGQRPSSRVLPTGQIQQVIEITFQTVPGGYAGSVTVAQDRYNVDSVRDAITPIATEMENVANL